MANAQIVAATRVGLSLAAVSDLVRVTNIDQNCVPTISPDDAFTKTLSELNITDIQLDFLRRILAKECPEIFSQIMDRKNFVLATGTSGKEILDFVAAQLVGSPTFTGQCTPPPTLLAPNTQS